MASFACPKLPRGLMVLLLILPATLSATDSTPTEAGLKSNYDNEEGFAGPGSTVRQLEEDDEEKTPTFRFEGFDAALTPWFERKKRLDEDSGLQLGFAYTLTAQKASDSLTDEDSGATGILRVSGKWEAYNRGKKNI